MEGGEVQMDMLYLTFMANLAHQWGKVRDVWNSW